MIDDFFAHHTTNENNKEKEIRGKIFEMSSSYHYHVTYVNQIDVNIRYPFKCQEIVQSESDLM